MYQPDDPGQIIENHYHSNGANKIVWGIASVFGLALLTIGGVALHKLYDLGERMARVEIVVDYLAKKP